MRLPLSSMARKARQPVLLVTAALVVTMSLAAALRVAKAGTAGLTGDEGISLLAATCHQQDFVDTLAQRRPPYGAWVEASEWKRFVRPEHPLCLSTISTDLASTDFHPPLYFWVLHVWLWIAGATKPSLVALNIVFACGAVLGLYALGRRLFNSDMAGVALAVAWGANPLPALGGAEGRPYELLALCVVLLFERLARCTDPEPPPSSRDFAGLAAAAASGLLTQYLFLAVLPAAAVLGIARGRSAGLRRSAQTAAGIAIGLVVACLVHPVVQQIARRGGTRATSDLIGKPLTHADRAELRPLVDFFATPAEALRDHPLFAVGVLLALALTVAGARQLKQDRPRAVELVPSPTSLGPFLAAAAVGTATLWLYASNRLPRHAVGAKYVSFVFPLFAVGTVGVAAAVKPLRQWTLGAIVAIAVLTAVVDLRRDRTQRVKNADTTGETKLLAYFTTSWHPTAATLARATDATRIFLSKPADASGALYATWLEPVDAGSAVTVSVPSASLAPLLERLEADGYAVERSGTAKRNLVRFRVAASPATRRYERR